MKKTLIILTATLFITLTAKAQNLLFFGENSYPSAETFTLSNDEGLFGIELDMLFAKDGTEGVVVLDRSLGEGIIISGKLIFYLDDGTVLTCTGKERYDFVDNNVSTMYYLTEELLNKLKNSNINTVRYILKCDDCEYFSNGKTFSASNNGTPTKTIIAKFFDQ